MDAPPDKDTGTAQFVLMAELLTSMGFSAPQILAYDDASGLLILSDLGNRDVSQWIADHPDQEHAVYIACTDVLIGLNGKRPDLLLQELTPRHAADMIGILHPYYCSDPVTALMHELERAMNAYAPVPDTLALRDYHAENLIWRQGMHGHDRVGLLDFQDAFIAPQGYDLASLLRDARRDVDPKIAKDMVEHFSAATGQRSGFPIQLACLGVQRNLRILGVFARLARQGKPQYQRLMPRVWNNITHDLALSELRVLREAVHDTLNPPNGGWRE